MEIHYQNNFEFKNLEESNISSSFAIDELKKDQFENTIENGKTDRTAGGGPFALDHREILLSENHSSKKLMNSNKEFNYET